MKKILCPNNGDEYLVDDALFPVLSKYQWTSRDSGYGNFYAIRTSKINKKWKTISMHRIIVGAKKGSIVDHINRNCFDNRKQNLRIALNSQNQINSSKIRGQSKYKGVTRVPKKPSQWKAHLRLPNRKRFQRYFKTEIEAAIAYNEAAKKYYGEFAYLNPV